MSHAFILVKSDFFVPLWEHAHWILPDWNQCKELLPWNIGVLVGIPDHWRYIKWRVQHLNDFETVVKNASEFTNRVSVHESALFWLTIDSFGISMTSFTNGAKNWWTVLPYKNATSGPYTFLARLIFSVVTGEFLIEFILITCLRSAIEGQPSAYNSSRALLARETWWSGMKLIFSSTVCTIMVPVLCFGL